MIESNAAAIADAQQRRIGMIEGAIRAGVAKGALAIERAATLNLTGAGEPYSYPVPVRTGNLRRGMGVEQPQPVLAIIFNGVEYAWAVHSGDVSEWRSHYAGPSENLSMMISRPARPFLDDAVAKTPWADIVIDAVSQKLIGGNA